jgi:hypothetical protein
MSGPHQHRTLRDTLLPKLLSGELSLAALRESMDEMDPMDTSKKPTQR